MSFIVYNKHWTSPATDDLFDLTQDHHIAQQTSLYDFLFSSHLKKKKEEPNYLKDFTVAQTEDEQQLLFCIRLHIKYQSITRHPLVVALGCVLQCAT